MSLHDIEGTVLRLEVQPSRLLLRAQFLVHGLALMVLAYPLGVPLWVRVLLFAGLVASLLFTLRSDALTGVRDLLLDGGNQWFWRRADGVLEALRLRDDSWLGTHLAVLRFERESGGRTLNVIILPDSVDADSFRRLRVRLRQAPAESRVSSLSG
ncbi:MAG TPA: hypothetical protein ENI93_05160 [Gammaproteobacteria bacterium]|nr:hypothetical protein [Gammaproteobacteria bacterium]